MNKQLIYIILLFTFQTLVGQNKVSYIEKSEEPIDFCGKYFFLYRVTNCVKNQEKSEQLRAKQALYQLTRREKAKRYLQCVRENLFVQCIQSPCESMLLGIVNTTTLFYCNPMWFNFARGEFFLPKFDLLILRGQILVEKIPW